MTFVEKVLTVAGKDGLTLGPVIGSNHAHVGQWYCKRWSGDKEVGYGVDAVAAFEDAFVKATARRVI